MPQWDLLKSAIAVVSARSASSARRGIGHGRMQSSLREPMLTRVETASTGIWVYDPVMEEMARTGRLQSRSPSNGEMKNTRSLLRHAIGRESSQAVNSAFAARDTTTRVSSSGNTGTSQEDWEGTSSCPTGMMATTQQLDSLASSETLKSRS
jgi:hypothetical protein